MATDPDAGSENWISVAVFHALVRNRSRLSTNVNPSRWGATVEGRACEILDASISVTPAGKSWGACGTCGTCGTRGSCVACGVAPVETCETCWDLWDLRDLWDQ